MVVILFQQIEMIGMHFQVKAPGKLMIAGEYAVIEPGCPAIVSAVDRYITIDVKESTENLFSLPQLGITHAAWRWEGGAVRFDCEDPKLRFIQNALAVFHRLLEEKSIALRSLHLTVTSELDDAATGQKYGLGSSAAVLAAVFSALLHIYERLPETKETIFKLASIAHLKTQGNGSGADIAASVYGGWIKYTAFRPDWIFSELEKGRISRLLDEPWPYLSIERLDLPQGLQFCAGWTGKSAATGLMVERIGRLKKTSLEKYKAFLEESTTVVEKLAESFARQDPAGALASIARNRRALQKLGAYADTDIETEKLKQLADIADRFGAGKSSGAGGGDCGIAFVDGEEKTAALHAAWEKAGIVPLPLQVSTQGVSVIE